MPYARIKQNFVYYCQYIPILYQYSITLFLIVSTFLFWHYCVGNYIENLIQQNDFEYQQLQEQYSNMHHKISDYETLSNQTHTFLYQTQQTKQMSYDDVIFSIINTAGKHSLKCVQHTHDKNIKRESYTKKQISFALHGDIKNINKFFQHMHTVPELISCNALSISKQASEYEVLCIMRYGKIKPLQLSLKS